MNHQEHPTPELPDPALSSEPVDHPSHQPDPSWTTDFMLSLCAIAQLATVLISWPAWQVRFRGTGPRDGDGSNTFPATALFSRISNGCLRLAVGKTTVPLVFDRHVELGGDPQAAVTGLVWIRQRLHVSRCSESTPFPWDRNSYPAGLELQRAAVEFVHRHRGGMANLQP